MFSRQIPPDFDVSQANSVTGFASWTNPENVVDSDTTDFAVASIGLVLGGSATISVTNNDFDYSAGDFAGFVVSSSSLLDIGVNTTTTVRTYLNDALQETYVQGSLAQLNLGPSDQFTLGFLTTQDFDEIEITFSVSLGLDLDYNVYYAVVERFCEGPGLECNEQTAMNKPTFPVLIDYENTGSDDLDVAYVDDAEDAVSASTSDYASLIYLLSALGSTYITIAEQVTDYPAGTFVGFDIENTTVVGLSLLGNLTITSYLNGVQQQEVQGLDLLLGAPLLQSSGRQTVGFVTSTMVDAVKLTVDNPLSINLGTTRVYSAIFQEFCAGPDLPCNEVDRMYLPEWPVYINTENTGLTGAVCGGCSIENTGNLIDNDPNSYAEIDITAGVATVGSISVRDAITDYGPNTFAGFHIRNVGLADLGVLDGITIRTYLDGAQVEEVSGEDLIVGVGTFLFSDTSELFVGFVTTSSFNEVQLRLTNVGMVDIGTTLVYDAVLGGFCEAEVECDTTYFLNSPDFPVYVNFERTGVDGILCAECSVRQPDKVITSSNTDYGIITVVAGVGNEGSIAVTDALYTYPAGTIAGFVIEDVNDILQADLFASLTIATYLDGVLQESESGANLIDAELLVLFINPDAGVYNVGFETTLPFDEVRIIVGDLVSAVNIIRVYGAFVDTRNSDGGELDCPDAPVAADDMAETNEGEEVEVDVLDNDSDTDSPLGLPDIVTNPGHGMVAVNSDSTISYTPDPDFVGVDSFTYEICDDRMPPLCDSATVFITVNPVTDTVEANIPNDSTLTLCANDLTTFSEPTSSIAVCGGPTEGNVDVTGSCASYTADPGYEGPDQFCLVACDPNNMSLCDTTIVMLAITLPNEPPVANDDVAVTDVDQDTDIDVLANDSDPDGMLGDPVVIDAPSNGTATVNPDNTINYDPDIGFMGLDSFTYQICDDGVPVLCDTALVIVSVGQELDTIPCNTFSPQVFPGFDVSQTNSTTGAAFWDDPEEVIDDNLSNFATATIGILVGGSATLRVTNNTDTYDAGSFAGFLISSGSLLDLGINNTITVNTYDGGILQETYAVGDLVGLNIAPNEPFELGFITTLSFDAIEITFSTSLGLDIDYNVYYAIVERYCAGQALSCNVQTSMNKPAYPMTIDYAGTGSDDLTVSYVDDPQNAISASTTDYASLVYVASLSGSTFITIQDQVTDYPAGTYAGFDIENITVVGLSLLSNLTITTYLDGVQQEDVTGMDLLIGAPLLQSSGRQTVGFVTTMSFDAVRLTIDNPLNATLGTTRVYSAIFTSFCVGPDLPCNELTPVSLPDYPVYINTVNTGLTGAACGGCEVENPGNVIDGDPDSFAEVDITAGVATVGSISVKDALTDYAPVGFAGFRIENVGLADLGVLDGVTITTYLDDVEQESASGTDLLVTAGTDLLVNTGEFFVGIETTMSFDEVQISLTNVGAVNIGTTLVYEAVFAAFCEAEVICDTTYFLNSPDFPVYVDFQLTGLSGAVCGLCEVEDPDEVITQSNTDFATIMIDVGVLNTGSIAVRDALYTYPAGTVAGFVIDDVNDLLQADLFGSLTISTYLNGVFQESESGGNLIDAELLVLFINPDAGVYNVGFETTMPFDEVRITVGALGSVINIINVYGAFVDTENSNGGELLCNNPPIAIDDFNHTPQDEPASGNVLTNDEDPEGNNLTVSTTPVDGPDNGMVVLNPDGSYTYTPNPGFTGEDQFTYEVCDDGIPSLCDTATVYIEVIPNTDGNNRPPIANPDANQTEEDTPVMGDLLSNDSDPDGDSLVINTTPVTNPANGTVTINPDGTYTYIPDGGFTGQDMFTYEVCDDGTPSLCDTTVVVIDVLPDRGNSTFAHDDASVTNQDTPVSGNVSDNDFDAEGDNQTVNSVPVQDPSNGTVVLAADGSYTYTPDPGFVGNDFFIYETCDNGAPPVCDQATVYIAVLPHNDPPLAIDDINNTPQDEPASGNVLTNDSDPNGDNLTVSTTPLDMPDNGSVALNPDGSYTYTPVPGFSGEDQFTYEVCDDGTPPLCDTATVYIEIVPNPDGENRPPIANPDANQTEQDTPVDGDLLSNDSDPDGDNLVIDTIPVTDPANGTVVINSDGTYTYTPDPGFTGQDVFTYEVCDDGSPSLCDTAIVLIDVLPDDGNNTFAHDDAAVTDENTPVSGNVSDNDFDPEGNNQTVNTTPVTGPTNGTVMLSADGSYTYTPNPGFVGNDFFTYETCDDGVPQACDVATVSIAVMPHNDPPIAVDDEATTDEDMSVVIDVLQNDSDPDSPLGLPQDVTDPPNGTTTVNPDSTITYTPDQDFVGVDSFTYVICDDATPSLCDTATVIVNVIPQIDTVMVTIPEDSMVTFCADSLTNFGAPAASIEVCDPPSNGSTSISGTCLTYMPAADWSGVDTMCALVCNGDEVCDTTIIIINVVCPTVAIQVFLEGPYDTVAQNEMFTTLNYYHVLPGQDPDMSENIGAQLLGVAAPPGQPYNTAPWNWSGTEGDDYGDGAGDIPYPETVVDWVLVSVRETDSLAASEVWKCAGLLHSDGSVEFPEQCECAHPLQNGNDYYIVVEHRNHLPIMSYKQTMTGNVLSHDFTQSDSWIYEFMNIPLGSGQKEIDGTYMMFAGNSEQLSARVDINSSDDAQWIEDNSAIFTYVLGDHNLNGDTNATDEFIWIINNSTFTLLPF